MSSQPARTNAWSRGGRGNGRGGGAWRGGRRVHEGQRAPPPEEEDGDDSSVGGDADGGAAAKVPKHRFAVVFGYVGARYQGLQKNPGARSVEAELERALHVAGLIPASKVGDLAKVGWNRAARTDKGVHAAGNVISFRARIASGGEAAAVAAVNAALEPDVRVFDIIATTKSFNSKNFCSSRRYAYLLPTFVLKAKGPPAGVARLPTVPEPIRADFLRARGLGPRGGCGGMSRLAGLAPELIAADAFCNGTALTAAAMELRAMRSAWTDTVRSQVPLSEVGSAGAGAGAALTAAATPMPVFSMSPPDAYQCGSAFVAAAAERRALVASLAVSARGPFRLPTSQWDRLLSTLQAYLGTHAFHNFSPHVTAGDATTARYIMDVAVSRPFILSTGGGAIEQEYVHITLVGQSFLLNQIRHMVGLAIDVTRGAAPRDVLQWVFSAGKLKLPLAPAEGLYLDKCFFASYDSNYASGRYDPSGIERVALTTLREPAAALYTHFKQEIIWPHMAAAGNGAFGEGAKQGKGASKARKAARAAVADAAAIASDGARVPAAGGGEDENGEMAADDEVLDGMDEEEEGEGGAGAGAGAAMSVEEPRATMVHAAAPLTTGGVGGPFHAFLRDLNDSPITYTPRFDASVLAAVQQQAAAKALKRSRFEMQQTCSGEIRGMATGISGVGGEEDEAIDARFLPALQSVIRDGSALSKVAREKREWKVALRSDKERCQEEAAAKRAAKEVAGGRVAPALGVGEGAEAPAGEGAGGDGAGAGAGGGGQPSRGGGRGRGYWRHRDEPRREGGGGAAAPQVWRPAKRGRS